MTHYPETLKSLPIWALWRLERDKKDRLTKVPYSPHYNGRASSTKPKTWGTFNQAIHTMVSRPDYYNGISLIISKEYGLVFIDIDHCIDEDGSLSDIASDIIGAFGDQYVEISQSGTGIHLITKGTIPKNFKNPHNGVEMYFDKRFCALTGNTLKRGEPTEDQDAVDYVFNRYKTPEREIKRVRTNSEALNRDDKWIVEHASGRGQFADLFSGNWSLSKYGSQSEADLALCMILAFWTDCDPDQIDRIFRSSGLYRDKWERSDYRDRTIQTAIDQCDETLSEFIKRRDEERGRDYVRTLSEKWDG